MGDGLPRTSFPGWNDPPNVQYNPNGALRVRSMLNKRVAFPLQSGASSDGSPKPMAIVPPSQSNFVTLPPLPSQMPLTTNPIAVVHPMPHNNVPRIPTVATVTNENLSNEDNSFSLTLSAQLPCDGKNFTINTFRDQILQDDELQEPRREEIINRFVLIEQLWDTDALIMNLKLKLFNLAKAVRDKNYNGAMNLYTEIVTYHSSECALWSMALRHVVLTLLPRHNNSVTEVTEATVTATTGAGAGAGAAGPRAAVRGAVPSMVVPASPRNTLINTSDENVGTNATGTNAANVATVSAVQHI